MKAHNGVRAVLVALAILMVGLGLVGTVLGVRGTREFSAGIMGLSTSVHYVGFLVGGIVVPRLVSSVGHIRVYSALASTAAVVMLVFPFAVNAPTWVTIRLLSGAAISGLYIVAESWLNAVSTNANRGRLLAIYLVSMNIAIAMGQLLASATGVDDAFPFVVASALMSLSVIPLSLSRSPAPMLPPPLSGTPVRAVLDAAPLAPVGSLISGMGVSIATGMVATYGVLSGLDVNRIAVMSAAGMLGGVLLQWPIGALSDRMSRRHVIMYVAAASSAVALTGLLAASGSIGTLVAFAAFTALSFPLYSLAITHLNDAIDPALRVPASAVLVMAYGIGSIIGPLVAGVAMNQLGPNAFWWLLAASTGVLLPYAAYRALRRPGLSDGATRLRLPGRRT